MKKWIAAILTLVMLAQALPWTAFADAVATGQMITDSELQRALQIAGLQTVSGGVSANAEGSGPFRLEAKESGYHAGMKPNETWDAQMLMDWLDDTLTRAIYNVIIAGGKSGLCELRSGKRSGTKGRKRDTARRRMQPLPRKLRVFRAADG